MSRESTARELTGLANLLSDHTDRTLQSVDLLLVLLTSRLDPVLAGDTRDIPGALHSVLSRDTAALPQIRRAFVLDETGTTIADSLYAESVRFNASDRMPFAVHKVDPSIGLFISEPIRSRIDDGWVIVLSRRLAYPDGRFAGTVAITIRSEYFTEIFRASMVGPETRVVLSRDGAVMATDSSDSPPEIGRRFPTAIGLFPSRRGLASGISPVFGFDRLSAFARSDRYPLMTIVVTRPVTAIRAATAGSERIIIAAGVFISGLVVLVGWMFAGQLRSLQYHYRDGVDRMSDGFVLLDDHDRLMAWNAQIEKLAPAAFPFMRVGLPLRELLGKVFAHTHPHLSLHDREGLVRSRYEAVTSTEPRTLETSDNRVVEVQTSVTRFGGKVIVFRDVTSRKRHEDALERALEIERAANEQHRRFVAMASHEFRTPLALIDGAAQRLQLRITAGPADDAAKLNRIRKAVRSMSLLIDRTLSSARLEAGTITLEAQDVDLRSVVEPVCERQRQISPDFEIVCTQPDIPLPLRGDPRLLDQAFTNLVSNAVKYSGRARRIDVDSQIVEEPTPSLRVRIRDRGVGVPADEIGKLFGRFFRASSARGISGTGIGLHLTRELVQLHGGTIEVESRLGEGTTFIVTLPCADTTPQADAA